LIAPLNEAILESEDGKATPVSQLVQGLPKELAKKCSRLSPAEVTSARVSPDLNPDRESFCRSDCELAPPMWLTRYMGMLQEYISRILAHNISNAVTTVLKTADPKTMPRFFTEPVHQLAEYLSRELDTLEKVERFDIPVTAADLKAFKGSKPAGLTTYASWIWDALYVVGHSLRPDHTALGQDVGLSTHTLT
jgi:hypothetical protein